MENHRPDFDDELQAISDYVHSTLPESSLATNTAFYTLLDSVACALMALAYPACTKLLGPLLPGLSMPNGVPIPGLPYQLDPVEAAFNIGCMIRWLDFNDTWLAAEWGHPSDNLGCILALCDYATRHRGKKFTIKDILNFMIKAHEIQGVLALENSFNEVGLDHVLLVKVASTSVACAILDFSHEQTLSALSQAWLDGQSLRTYRHAPNTGSRKSWAAGDATARAVRLALLTEKGETGYPSVLTAKRWGFQDVCFRAQPLTRKRQYGSYVMENILWKIAFPAEFHAQTAAECAITLHPLVKNRINNIIRVDIETQKAGATIIDKQGPLHNPADRDHCIQYITAIGLIFGELNAGHYEDQTASDPRIDALRQVMQVTENPLFTVDYFDPNKRAIGNAVQVFFDDGSCTDKIHIDYPIGHRRRRQEGIPRLLEKFTRAVVKHYENDNDKVTQILSTTDNMDKFLSIDVTNLMDLLHHNP